jgi:peroxiredoxin
MPKPVRLRFNDPAPDLELTTSDGDVLSLSSLWRNKTLVLAFTRHFGCPQCKEMLDELTHIQPELAGKGLSLVVITQGTREQTHVFCSERAPGILCLSDPERIAYSAYGLGRGTLRQTFLSPRVWRSNRRLIKRRGWKTELPPEGQDAMLMSGIFIIGPDGLIRLPYYYEDIADHPPADLLVKGILGTGWQKPLESPLDSGPMEDKPKKI